LAEGAPAPFASAAPPLLLLSSGDSSPLIGEVLPMSCATAPAMLMLLPFIPPLLPLLLLIELCIQTRDAQLRSQSAAAVDRASGLPRSQQTIH